MDISLGDIVLLVLGISIPLGIGWIWSKRKSLSYTIKTNTPVFAVRGDMKDQIQITFQDQKVTDLYLVELIVKNDGNLPIKPDDFERPMIFDFGENAFPLRDTAGVTEQNPSNLSASIEWTHMRHEGGLKPFLSVSPLLLNKGDWFTIKLLLSDGRPEIKVDARIAGVDRILERKFTYESVGFPLPFPAVAGLMVVLMALAFLASYWTDATTGLLISFLVVMLGIFTSTVASYFYNRLRKR